MFLFRLTFSDHHHFSCSILLEALEVDNSPFVMSIVAWVTSISNCANCRNRTSYIKDGGHYTRSTYMAAYIQDSNENYLTKLISL